MNSISSVLRAYSAPEVSVCEIKVSHVFCGSPMGGGNDLTHSYWGDSEESEY